MAEEIWASIEVTKKNYSVSNWGRVRNNKTNRIIRPKISTAGYFHIGVQIDKKKVTYLVHRLVLFSFSPIENAGDLHAHHINYIRTDNRLENLAWLTREDNAIDKKHTSRSLKLFMALKRKYSDAELCKKLEKL